MLTTNLSLSYSKGYMSLCLALSQLFLFQDRAFPSTLIEMKKLLSESTRFRNEEVPLRQREKQKLFHQYRELEVIYLYKDLW